jgi:hypothetical protein
VVAAVHEAKGEGEAGERGRKERNKGEGMKVHRAGDEAGVGVGVGVMVWVKDKGTAQQLYDKGIVHIYLRIDFISMV